mmetsp:Transcript_14453/g.41391  ORF Transcript_14453/g.41391 Transcript_14453/m.41391 type:complete len:227 (+) Transcript_14453:297-977(+)
MLPLKELLEVCDHNMPPDGVPLLEVHGEPRHLSACFEDDAREADRVALPDAVAPGEAAPEPKVGGGLRAHQVEASGPVAGDHEGLVERRPARLRQGEQGPDVVVVARGEVVEGALQQGTLQHDQPPAANVAAVQPHRVRDGDAPAGAEAESAEVERRLRPSHAQAPEPAVRRQGQRYEVRAVGAVAVRREAAGRPRRLLAERSKVERHTWSHALRQPRNPSLPPTG